MAANPRKVRVENDQAARHSGVGFAMLGVLGPLHRAVTLRVAGAGRDKPAIGWAMKWPRFGPFLVGFTGHSAMRQ